LKNHTALLIIDVQLGMFEESDPVYNGEALINTLQDLIGRARAAGIPVIFVQHDGQGDQPLRPDLPGWPIHPAIQPGPAELVVHKHDPDSFQETSLQQELDALGIKNLVVAGIQTEFCVDTTCRRAYSLGYKVTLVQDAHTTWHNEHLQASQIIAHHNLTLGNWFVSLKPANGIQFE